MKQTKSNIHIKDSYGVSKHDFTKVLEELKQQNPDSPVWNRSFESLRREWATHNLLYSLGIFRSRTADVDLDYPQAWYMRFAYTVVGTIALWIIR